MVIEVGSVSLEEWLLFLAVVSAGLGFTFDRSIVRIAVPDVALTDIEGSLTALVVLLTVAIIGGGACLDLLAYVLTGNRITEVAAGCIAGFGFAATLLRIGPIVKHHASSARTPRRSILAGLVLIMVIGRQIFHYFVEFHEHPSLDVLNEAILGGFLVVVPACLMIFSLETFRESQTGLAPGDDR